MARAAKTIAAARIMLLFTSHPLFKDRGFGRSGRKMHPPRSRVGRTLGQNLSAKWVSAP